MGNIEKLVVSCIIMWVAGVVIAIAILVAIKLCRG